MGGPGLNTEIFATGRTAEAAQRAKKLENLYHVGQHKLWDGRQVLEDLQSRHGRAPAELPRAQREALAAVVGGLMWGELAAWQISAQLADRLVHYEGKLAATSQVHDEARHFYVLHDYLRLLELPQPPLEGRTRALIDVVLTTNDLVHKLIGMQLFIESVALTLFKALRDRAVCPILTELLMFFERDEARHVGFGVQLTPDSGAAPWPAWPPTARHLSAADPGQRHVVASGQRAAPGGPGARSQRHGSARPPAHVSDGGAFGGGQRAPPPGDRRSGGGSRF